MPRRIVYGYSTCCWNHRVSPRQSVPLRDSLDIVQNLSYTVSIDGPEQDIVPVQAP